MIDIVKIQPRAANAFEIIVYNHLQKVAYILDVHTDGERLHILARDAEGKIANLKLIRNRAATDKLDFTNLTIEPKEGKKKA